MTVVVGGSARKAGKTTVICEIIAATREAKWIAVKLTPHAHESGPGGDSDRYLAAGATRAVLSQDLPSDLAGGTADKTALNLIIESNSVLATLAPDLFVFVRAEGEQKPSAIEHAHKADIVLHAHATPELISRIRNGLQRTRG